MGKLIMAYWDCPVCGNQGIRGDVMNCPSCGRARGDVQFYMKEGSQEREANQTGDLEYLSDEKAAEMGKNPDWYCSFCNSLNRDNAAFCSNCGASRESSESNYFDQLKKRQEKEAAEKAAQPQVRENVKPQKKKSPLLILLVIAVAIVGLVMFLNGNTTRGDLKVTGLNWTRSIPIEQYLQFSESAWDLPQGAELTSKKNEIHHYDQVLDHYEEVEVQRSRRVLDHYETYYTYEDRGNGTFEQIENQRPVYTTEYYTETESRPVYVPVPRYATKYYYNIWRWTEVRTETAAGTDHEAAWPELNLKEDEREGSPRAERYTFTVQDKKDKVSVWETTEEAWRNIQPGNVLSITSKRTGADAWITDEKGNQIAQVRQIQ